MGIAIVKSPFSHHEALLVALKDGMLTGKKHTDDDIAELKSAKCL